jgi:hypothetical protein
VKDGFASVDFTTLSANGSPSGGGVPKATASQITMTTAVGQASSAWLPTKETVGNGFTTQFQFQITGGITTIPADGLAFVIQNSSSSALGGGGGGIGYDGVSKSLAIEFDTFQNTNLGDPDTNHIAVQSNGTAANSSDHTTAAKLALVSGLATTLANGNPHTVKIAYDGNSTMVVFLDGNQVLSASVNLSSLGLDTGGKAFIGFTSATGTDGEILSISGWSFAAN